MWQLSNSRGVIELPLLPLSDQSLQRKHPSGAVSNYVVARTNIIQKGTYKYPSGAVLSWLHPQTKGTYKQTNCQSHQNIKLTKIPHYEEMFLFCKAEKVMEL